jgi:hypothetical protein
MARNVLLLFCLGVLACSPLQTPPPQAGVCHVVVCWLKEPGNPAQREELIRRSQEFKAIPGVIRVQAGTPLPAERAVVDGSYDVAVAIDFRDEAALRAYETHPLHQKAVEEVLKPLVGKFVIYDFKAAGGSAP